MRVTQPRIDRFRPAGQTGLARDSETGTRVNARHRTLRRRFDHNHRTVIAITICVDPYPQH
jgi:hypothetical protein